MQASLCALGITLTAALTTAGKTSATQPGSQKPAAREHRAFWCHSAHGIAGMSWDQAIKVLADNGFTAILPNMCWGGVAY